MEEFLKENKYLEAAELLRQNQDDFWKNEYLKLDENAKIDYWSKGFYDEMRWNGDTGFDEMAIFYKDNYEMWKKREPKIDELLPAIFKRLKLNEQTIYKLLRE